MQGAFDYTVFDKALRQQGLSMRTHVFDGVDLITQQIDANLLVADLRTQREVGIQLIERCNVLPISRCSLKHAS